ncbi:hypothetical protein MMC29_002156 [Sticta canariensis]|nr:hypothetical protein [Sticta canariensis]
MLFSNAGEPSKAAFSLLPPKGRKSRLSASQIKPSKNRNVVEYLSALRSLPRYEEGRLQRICALGSGTSFQVDKANDEETGALVIVKTPQVPVQNTQETSTKVINHAVLQELKISTYIPFKRHRNITQTLGFELISIVNNEPILSLVAEFSEYGSLSHYFEKLKSPPSCSDWEQRTSFAVDVVSALEALHSCRVVHGDIKPDNVLIFRNEACGPPLKAKLSDFGSAIVEDTLFPGKKNIPCQIYRGTLIYVPPLVRQAGTLPFHILPACDVFSFGLLLWSIFKGCSYYDSSWKEAGQSDREFLDEIGVGGLVQLFHEYISDEKKSIPIKAGKLLNNAFLGCVVDISWDSSPLVPSVREGVLKTAFSKIRHIKSILVAEIDFEQFVILRLPNANDIDRLTGEGDSLINLIHTGTRFRTTIT